MPEEQPRLSGHSPCATSSKNAKDKSNSTTLQAMRSAKDADASSGRGSHCSSEKDSGYSDSSDWQQTDVEDQQSNKNQSGPATTPQPGQGNPGNPALRPAGHERPPVYIIKNMVLKEPDIIQKRDQLPKRTGSREMGSSGVSYRILLQQPSLSPATLKLHKPMSRMSSTSGKKINGAYLPILNSYPRIAPHPSKKPPDKTSSIDESQNLSKRVCTEHKGGDTPEQHLYKQPKLAALTSGLSCSSSTSDSVSSSSPTTVSSSQSATSGSSLYTTSSRLITRALHRNSTTSTCHRRFLNTVEILKQSGLLDITLRAKELQRQSNATERDIAQLRQHTELLCQAASNPSRSLSGVTAWEHLQRAMAESGSYPGLKILQKKQTLCHPDSASQPESISAGGANRPQTAENSEVPPSRRFATIPAPNRNCPVPQQSHSGQGRELVAGHECSEKVTFMPPDSSTG
ncbi:CLOCK-interacting pacemaker [Pempheris klunzingeri]|uniref:CLOCK-interacting pacemaker n=1 Tax=Pempheris klunzingeri TaxID=3127111 RepID=UPI003981097B